MRTLLRRPFATLLLTSLALSGAACNVGPDYHRPDLNTPGSFKSTTQPSVSAPLRMDWWTLFNDPDLTALEQDAVAANYDLQAAVQRVTQAREAAAVASSAFYPVITLDPQLTRSRSPGGTSANRGSTATGSNTSSARTSNFAQVPFDLSYEIDIWGRVRRSVESAKAQAEASSTDLAVVRQTVTADVAQNYFTLRSLDAQIAIVDRNCELFRNQLRLTKSQNAAGLVGQADVLQAQTQLDATLAQSKDLNRQRADVEHALAILIGKPPSELTIRPLPLDAAPPTIPAGLPADLLKQRPDVAEAEQNLIAANAQIGVAKANFYPNVSLTASGGFESVDIKHTFDWQNRFWSIGPSATIPLFEGGRLNAQLRQAKARYEELVATYRNTVLGAFRDVEDSLTDLHYRADQANDLSRAVAAARESVRLSELLYRQGLTSYLQVISADRTLLTNELSAAQVQEQRMIAAVLLIKAMGGGWSVDLPPTTMEAPSTTQPSPTQP